MASKLKFEHLPTVSKERQQIVAQRNDFIRHPRNPLTAQEQNIIHFLISKIKPTDKDFMERTFTISEFCDVCGIDGGAGKNHQDIKAALISIRDKRAWVQTDDGIETIVSWVDTAKIDAKNGIITVIFSQSIKPFLLDLIDRGNYTQAELINFLALRSKYGKRLYEILKSHSRSDYRLVFQDFEIEELKRLLNAENYTRYPDFQRYVLDISVREITTFTDIEVFFNPTKTGRKYTGITFNIRRKKPHERFESYSRATKSLDLKSSEQLALNDL